MHKNRFDELTSLMAKKDTKAFDLFYNEYGGFIYSVIKVVCKEKELTEEVVDDVLIKVWNLAHKLVHIENPEGWLYKVSRNTAINAVKVAVRLRWFTRAAQTTEILKCCSAIWCLKKLFLV